MVLDNPPLNLFGDDAWQALVDCIDEVEGSDARALVWRAEGDIFTGGVDVNGFQQVVERGRRRRVFGSLLDRRAAARGAADPHPRPGPRPLPDRRARGLARLRHDLGDRVGAKFGLVEAVVGLTPGAGGTQRMAERAGPGAGAPSS